MSAAVHVTPPPAEGRQAMAVTPLQRALQGEEEEDLIEGVLDEMQALIAASERKAEEAHGIKAELEVIKQEHEALKAEREQLLAAIPSSAIQLQRQLRFTQTAATPLHLLQPMAELGAGATSAPQLSAAAWRRLLRAWPEASGRSVRLSWRILLVLLRR